MSERATDLIAPPASVDTAATHACLPRGGHRCWQFDPAAAAIPRWVTDWTSSMSDGRIEFCDLNGSTGVYLEAGDWLVEFEDGEHADVYTSAAFAEKFIVVFQ